MYRILVIGEHCKDNFIYGEVTRIAPEAPAPVFVPGKGVTSNSGMASNVANNLRSLDPELKVTLLTQQGVITKTRFVDNKTNHLIMRLDEGEEDLEEYTGRLELENYNAIVISDYNKGFVSKRLIENIAAEHPYVFLDTKKILGDFCRDVKFIKINSAEWEKSLPFIDKEIQAKTIVTIGSAGAMYQDEIYPVEKVAVKDQAGAGDSFLAGLVYKYVTSRGDIYKSIEFANECATKVVMKRGIATI